MDSVLRTLTEFVQSVDFDSLPESVASATLRHHLDAVGCAAGGFFAEPCRVARRIARTGASTQGVSAYGLPEKTTPEYAAFTNGIATRYLDFNDGYAGLAPGGGVHPSDMAPAIVGAVETVQGGGKDVLVGVYIAYEIAATIADEAPLRANGWDQGANVTISTAAALGKVLGLDDRALANSISLAVTPNIPLHATRSGELSHWKAGAGPYAASAAMWATRMAAEGMTGPAKPFEGVHGYWENIHPVTLERLGEPVDGKSGIERVFIKPRPSEAHSLAPLDAVLRIRDRFNVEEIESIEIQSYHMTWHEIGGGADDAEEKWDPKTRETADHSLPYVTAVALVDGDVTVDSFTPERIGDPTLRPLMQKISVTVDDELEAAFQDSHEMSSRVIVRLSNGETIEEDAKTFRGKPENPMSDEGYSAKFMSMAGKVLPSEEAERMLGLLWDLPDLEKLDELTSIYRRWDDYRDASVE